MTHDDVVGQEIPEGLIPGLSATAGLRSDIGIVVKSQVPLVKVATKPSLFCELSRYQPLMEHEVAVAQEIPAGPTPVLLPGEGLRPVNVSVAMPQVPLVKVAVNA